jgi:hypothetical protein
MNVTTIGIDLAKNIFGLHGVDPHGKTVLKKTVCFDRDSPCSPSEPAYCGVYGSAPDYAHGAGGSRRSHIVGTHFACRPN